MPYSSRFTRPGNQPFRGSLIIVRRGSPLPNKGRHSFLGNEDRIWGEGDENHLETIIQNNPLARLPYRLWQDLSFTLAVETNNPNC